jgi:hypothetical protein
VLLIKWLAPFGHFVMDAVGELDVRMARVNEPV